jgi:hypothetical protein
LKDVLLLLVVGLLAIQILGEVGRIIRLRLHGDRGQLAVRSLF